MSVRRIQIDDEAGFLAVGGQIDDDSEGWWGGAQRCFARVALATALAATTLAAQLAAKVQQDPEEISAASLANFASPEEDYWQNPVEQSRSRGVEQPNFSACRLLNFWTLDDDPAGSLYGAQEETEWQNPVEASRSRGVAQSNFSTSQLLNFWTLDDDPAGSLLKFTSPDEDFWENPVNPVPPAVCQQLPYLEDAEEIPAGSLYGVPEETEWRIGVAPAPPCVGGGLALPWGPQGVPLQDLGDEPAGSLFGVPEETEWRSGVVPAAPANFQGLPYAQGEGADVAPSAFTPEEDYWQSWTPPTQPMRPAYLPDVSADEAPPLLRFSTPDEDYWGLGAGAWGLGKPPIVGVNLQPLAPSPQTLYLPDLSDDPAGTLYGVPEETEWRSGVAPAPPCVGAGLALPWGPQGGPLQDLGDEPAGSLLGVPEETEWRSGVVPAAPANFQALPYAQGEGAEVVPSAFPPEEDYWQNPVEESRSRGVEQANFSTSRLLNFSTLDDEPAGSLYGVPEETEWQPQTAPVPVAIYWQLPYAAGEQADVLSPAAFAPDEDYWQNPAEQARSRGVGQPNFSTSRLLNFWTSDDEPAGSLHGLPEETEWQNPFEQARSRGVEGLRFSTLRLLDFSTSGSAENVPAIVSDDDCWPPLASAAGGWRSSNIPAQAARAWLQGVCGFDELTCFWWKATWAVQTHSDARARMSHSIARGRLSRSTPRARVSRGVSRKSIW